MSCHLIYCSSLLTHVPSFTPICPTQNLRSILNPRVIVLKCRAVWVISHLKPCNSSLLPLGSDPNSLAWHRTLLTHLSTSPLPQTLSSGHPEFIASPQTDHAVHHKPSLGCCFPQWRLLKASSNRPYRMTPPLIGKVPLLMFLQK